jgi:hypothetical protein
MTTISPTCSFDSRKRVASLNLIEFEWPGDQRPERGGLQPLVDERLGARQQFVVALGLDIEIALEGQALA